MMSQEQNDLITRTGPKDACGKLMRMYWQPAALVDELTGPRPVKPVKMLGENLVLFRDEQGRYGLIERHCAHRGADLAFGRLENGGLRCAFHGWLFDVSGQCLETPAEPKDSPLCKNKRLSRDREERNSLGLSRRRRAAGVSGDRLFCRAG
jgi:phenylpropionate dioxygenase-like ring-hydroxylating dioxygenase large terminal subunit